MSGILTASTGIWNDGGDVVDLQVLFSSASGATPPVTAGYRLTSTGKEQTIDLGSYTDVGDYVIPTSNAGNYECRMTVNSGGPLDGGSSATGSWLALTSTRTWEITETNEIGESTVNLTIEIRPTGGSVLDSATFSMTATTF